MLVRMRTLLPFLAIGVVAPLVGGCGDDGPSGPIFTNPATITVKNERLGPVLFFFVRPCGTTDWGQDLLPQDPVSGTIQPGDERDFTVEAGCYDMEARVLPSLAPGTPDILQIFDNQVTSAQGFVWVLEVDPDPA